MTMTRKKEKSNKGLLQFFVVIAFIGAAVMLSQIQGKNGENVTANGSSENTLLVETVTIIPQELPLEFQTTGTVRVRNFVDSVPQVSGRVAWVNSSFREGGTFEKNETLFRIEQEDFKLLVDQAQAQVKQAETSLALQEAESQSAIEEWKILHPDQEAPALVARQPQLKQAQAELQSAKASLRDAQLDLNRSSYRLPYNGRVVNSSVEVGQYIQAGQSYGRVYSRDSLEVNVPISDDKLKWFDSKNANAKFKTIYQGKEVEINGKIARISNILDDETRFANIIVTPADTDWEAIIPGIFVDVKLEAQTMAGLWKIPNEAIQANKTLWVIDKDMKLTQIKPEIIFVNQDFTLAKSNGEEIQAVSGSIDGASEGMKVRVVGAQ